MARVRDVIKEIHARIASLGTSIDEVRTPVSSAPDQMSPEQTIAVLAPASEKITAIHGGIGAAVAKVGEVQQLVAATLQGGQPGPMLGRLDAIKQVLVAVGQRCNTAKQHVETALAEARQVGGSGKLSGGAGVPVQGSSPPRPPAHVEESGRRLPARTRRTAPTAGEFNGERIVSGEDDSSVADLQPFRSGGWPRVLVQHVESHVVARMRRQGLTEGELVLNNVTCGNRGFDNHLPATCDRFLPSILPAGARLRIWATEDGGQTWWTKTYVGTGERIRP